MNERPVLSAWLRIRGACRRVRGTESVRDSACRIGKEWNDRFCCGSVIGNNDRQSRDHGGIRAEYWHSNTSSIWVDVSVSDREAIVSYSSEDGAQPFRGIDRVGGEACQGSSNNSLLQR